MIALFGVSLIAVALIVGVVEGEVALRKESTSLIDAQQGIDADQQTSAQTTPGVIPPTGDETRETGLARLFAPWIVTSRALGIRPIHLFLVGISFILFGLMHNYRLGRTKQSPSSIETQNGRNVQNAIERFHQIKFQESFTEGWSGSLKLPVGLAGGLTGSSFLAERPLSFPEIVNNYREFIEVLTSDYVVIVGIDELDKMESDNAQRFTNEIKVIFGSEGCFNLLSVSQSAMSSFVRRGLPFRDVFDSSFDEILTVEYLDFRRARELVKRRVVGLPEPLIAFCYCSSGGLARDLIRTCRQILDEPHKAQGELSLGEVCGQSLELNLKAKIRAYETTVQDIWSESGSSELLSQLSELLSQLHEIGMQPVQPTRLRKRAEGLIDDHPASTSLRRVKREVATYLLFCAALQELFTDELD